MEGGMMRGRRRWEGGREGIGWDEWSGRRERKRRVVDRHWI